MTTLASTRSGSGKPLVLLHGLGGSKQSLNVVLVPYLSDCYEVVCFDLPGHGTSPTIDIPKIKKLISDVATMVTESLDELGIQEFALCGLSFGGTIAIDIAARYPERVKALVLQEAPYWEREFPLFYRLPFFFAEWLSRLVHYPSFVWWIIHHVPHLLDTTKKIVRFLFKSIISRKTIREHPERLASHVSNDNVENGPLKALLRAERMHTDQASWSAYVAALMQHDARKSIQKISCPTFLIGGRTMRKGTKKHSIYKRTLDSTADILKLLRRGHVPFIYPPVLIEGAGHDVPFTHPRVFTAHIRKFLSEHYRYS